MVKLAGFDANEYEGAAPGLVAEGPQEGVIVETDIKPNRNNNGQNFKLVFEITEGEFKGRRLYDSIVVEHKESERAVEIGKEKLASICKAVEVPKPSDSTELHNKPLIAVVKHKTSTWEGNERTNADISYYKAAEATPF